MKINILNIGKGFLALIILLFLFINYAPDDLCIWCDHDSDSHKTYVNGKLVSVN